MDKHPSMQQLENSPVEDIPVEDSPAANQELLSQLEKLKPKPYTWIINLITTMALIVFLLWYYPKFAEQPELYLLLLLALSAGVTSHRYNVNTNRRIDLVLKLMERKGRGLICC